ncbi:hypothetical protein [Actinacidiphila rubida]|uniref:Lipoprotein n=1 Tax=Actinacidiphila rubida TaxID=310780 RepID=A0A1H8JUW6_9ACTN|nr:hypothetical protein [Actinacidiphila rubida]SEN84305.1 hypothetical protein SAMN05216267_101155 [Actinacidiphila rubida]
MTRRLRAAALLPAAALAVAVLGGCAHHGTTTDGSGNASPSAPSASDLAHMKKLVDDADSAASAADKDASADK